jgi:predicted lipid-binding transport protein (Tim44 family)
MLLKSWTKGLLILFVLLSLSAWTCQTEAWARAGGGRSMGNRSRSMSGSRTSTSPRLAKPSAKSKQTRPSTAPPPSTAAPGGFWQSLSGGLLGGLVGGLLFRSLFGVAPAGGGGGFGLLDILLLAGLAYLVYWYIKRKRREAEVAAAYYLTRGTVELPSKPQYPQVYSQPRVVALERDLDLEQGLADIRQLDPAFDEAGFQDMVMDIFFKIQNAWTNRNMSSVKPLLTEELFGILQQEADQLKAQKIINRLENIAVRSVDITAAWQESDSDFITARVYANLLDYNVDEITGQVVEGSKTAPVKFQEYWTFTRPGGDNPWQLSAINQTA